MKNGISLNFYEIRTKICRKFFKFITEIENQKQVALKFKKISLPWCTLFI